MADHGEKSILVPVWIPVRSKRTQNRRCFAVWDSRFSCLFVYVRGIICS